MLPPTFDLAYVKQRLGQAAPATNPSEDALAAVATILRPGAEGAEVLFIARAERSGDPWSGHLAFPGGKKEPSDESLLHTAVRETEEEVGLVLSPGACLAALDVVAARSNGYRVAQFVFAVEQDAVARTSAEVREAMWVPIGRLARLEGAGTMKYSVGGMELDLPCLHIGPHVLWGMTYRMLMQLLATLGVKSVKSTPDGSTI